MTRETASFITLGNIRALLTETGISLSSVRREMVRQKPGVTISAAVNGKVSLTIDLGQERHHCHARGEGLTPEKLQRVMSGVVKVPVRLGV